MNKGDIALIYEDPYTCRKFEGKAELIEKLDLYHSDALEYWYVKFIDTKDKYKRWINLEFQEE